MNKKRLQRVEKKEEAPTSLDSLPEENKEMKQEKIQAQDDLIKAQKERIEQLEKLHTLPKTNPEGVVTTPKEVALEDMPLENIKDYRLYNEAASKLNRRAKKANKNLKQAPHPLLQCPVELHPTQRIVFNRNDQPENAIRVYLSNHLIHYDEILYPGKTYDIPHCVIHHLESKGYPVWKWRDNPDGSRETVISHKTPRFSLRTVFGE